MVNQSVRDQKQIKVIRLICSTFVLVSVARCAKKDAEDSIQDTASLKREVEKIVDVVFQGSLPSGWKRLVVNDAERRSGPERIMFNRNGNFLSGPGKLYIRFDRLPRSSSLVSSIQKRSTGKTLPGSKGSWTYFEKAKPKDRIRFVGMYVRDESATTLLCVTAMQIGGESVADTNGIREILSQL